MQYYSKWDLIRESYQSYGIFICLVLIALFAVIKSKSVRLSKQSQVPLILLSISVIALITFGIGADKPGYYSQYLTISTLGLPPSWQEMSDPGWKIITYAISQFCVNAVGYFLVVAMLYVVANAYFCHSQTGYYNHLFVAVISFMGFYSYGINTMRAGLALATLLYAMTKIDNSRYLFFIISVAAVFIHKSVAIPCAFFLLANYINKPKIYMGVWVLCLILSYITGGALKEYVILYLGEEDMRIGDYLEQNESDRYNVGFRWDFVLYSLFPIILGYWNIAKSRFEDTAYNRIFNTYVLANAFWLIVIYVPFSDRFAYLSWFLYPYVLLLPYYGRLSDRTEVRTAANLTIVIAGFNLFMIFI